MELFGDAHRFLSHAFSNLPLPSFHLLALTLQLLLIEEVLIHMKRRSLKDMPKVQRMEDEEETRHTVEALRSVQAATLRNIRLEANIKSTVTLEVRSNQVNESVMHLFLRQFLKMPFCTHWYVPFRSSQSYFCRLMRNLFLLE